MDEHEFQRLLDLFPVVRSRDYCAESEEGSKKMSAASESDKQVMDWHDAWEKLDTEENAVECSEKEDPFWMHLRSSVEEKMGAENAKHFIKAFQKAHEQLVNRAIPLDRARQIIAHTNQNAS